MFDDLLESVGGTPGRILGIGLALGLGIAIGRGIRPVAKGALRGYMSVADRVKEAAAEASEGLQDLYHEAKSEHESRAEPAPTERAA